MYLFLCFTTYINIRIIKFSIDLLKSQIKKQKIDKQQEKILQLVQRAIIYEGRSGTFHFLKYVKAQFRPTDPPKTTHEKTTVKWVGPSSELSI